MKKLKLLLLFFIINSTEYCCAQSTINGSLQKIINGNATTAEKIKAYKKYAEILSTENFDECLITAEKGFTLAEKNNDSVSMGECNKFTALAYYFKGSYDSASVFYYKALSLLKNKKDAAARAAVLNDLGKLYRKTKDLNRALQIYDEAFLIYKNANDQDGMATILNESGVVFEYKEEYEEAINRYKQSLAIREKLKDSVGIGYSYNFLGGVYTIQKKFDEAEKYLLASLKIRQRLKDNFAVALSFSDLGYTYTQQGNFEKAAEQYMSSNAIAAKMQFADLLLTNYKELSAIAEKTGDKSQALDYLKKHDVLKDSIYSSAKIKQIEELNAKYQTEKREQQLQLQQVEIKQKNYLLVGIISGVLLLLFAAFSFYKKRRIAHQFALQAEVLHQQDISTKAVIDAEENERKRIAEELHDGVGQMMSAAKMNLSVFEEELVFENDNQKKKFENVIALVDESCKEVRNVSHQMMPNALLKSGLASAVKEFISKIDTKIIKVTLHTEGLNERLEGNVETVLYRVIQECVNNVLKHSGASYLDIAIIKDDAGIAATIEDNGRGFDTSQKEKFEGIGLKNIFSRIKYLNGTIDFTSAVDEGTAVVMHLPVQK